MDDSPFGEGEVRAPSPSSSLGLGDLESYLNLPDLLTLPSSSPFLEGAIDALTEPCSLSFEDAPAVTAQPKVEPGVAALPGPSSQGVVSDDAGATDSNGNGTKRRRRTRNGRQQELNRLAQQRYRQRKKEKYSELQCTVGSLQSQLDRLSVLENEAVQLKATQAELQTQLASKDAALQQAAQQLRAAGLQLKAAQEKCAAQERTMLDQQQVIEQQRQQLKTTTLAGLDPQALSDRLLSIIKAALAEAEASAQGAATLTSEAVVQHISRTLTSCCRELVMQGRQPVAAEAPKAIPVSCF